MTTLNKGDMLVGNASSNAFSIMSAPSDGSLLYSDSTQSSGYNSVAKSSFALASSIGTIASQNSNSVSITGGAISGVTLDASKLSVVEGSNAYQGTATLVLGTVVVSNTSVAANSRIMLTAQDNSTIGALRVSARTAGTSFTITSSVLTDSGVVAYEIFSVG